MKLKHSLICALSAASISTTASAEMYWNDFSLSYLKGSNYEVGEDKRDVITFEHASGHSWGDTFMFIDRLESKSGASENYMEFSPRFSLGKLAKDGMSFGPVKDVLVATTWESGDGFDNFLYGLGVSLDVPGFAYFNANIYKANNEKTKDDEQLTLSWAYPFAIGNGDFVYDGFLDWATARDDGASEMNFTSQLKWNVGKALGTKSPLYVGIEYVYWNNKFGIKGVNERNPNLMVKWHF